MLSALTSPIRTAVRRAGIPTPGLLLSVSGSLLATMVLTAGLGAVFWWAAARLFTPAAVGIAAGSISAMTFLGSIAMGGAGTLLLRELPRNRGAERPLVSTAAGATAAVGLVLGIVYALVAPMVNPELAVLATSPLAVALFVSGVLLTILTSIADDALLAMLRARVRLVRNTIFAASKLVFLVPAALFLGAMSQRAIYGTWVAGLALSTAVVAVLYRRVIRPQVRLGLIRVYARPALLHFALSMAIAFPALAIPVIVSLLGSPVQAARFYVAWVFASVAFYPAVALAQSLFALGGRSPEAVWRYARTTMALSFGAGTAAIIGALLLGGPVLGLFGPTYHEAATTLPVLAAVAIPQTVKDHYQTLSRLRGGFGRAVIICVLGGIAEIVAAALGFITGGVAGLAGAWLAALVVEGAIMVPLTVRVARATSAAG